MMLDVRPEVGGFRGSVNKNPTFGKSPVTRATTRTSVPQSESFVSEYSSEKEEEGGGNVSMVASVPLVDRLSFNVFVAVINVASVVALGLEQDLAPSDGELANRFGWWIGDIFFCVCFVVEMVLRLICARSYIVDWFFDLWNLLDFLLVLAFVIDVLFLVPAGIGGAVRFLSVFRVLRAVQLVRLVRMLPAFRELWLLVGGLATSMKALSWVGLIILLMTYVGAIVVTTEIGQNHELYGREKGPSYDGEIWPYDKYFGNIPRSMFSLLQVITLDGWCDDIVRHVVHRQPLMGLFFVAFLLITAFGLMNIVIGIIVENTLAAAQVVDRSSQEHEAVNRKFAVERLADLLLRSDTRRTGEISLPDLAEAYENPVIRDLFKDIGMSLEEAEKIFQLLDYERSGNVELKRFANSCRELVGGARRRDIAQVEVTVGALARNLEQLDGQFSKIQAEVSSLNALADQFACGTIRELTGFGGASNTAPQQATGHLRQR